MNKTQKLLIAVIAVLLLCILVFGCIVLGSRFIKSYQKSASPLVYFHSPTTNSKLQAGELEIVHIVATDPEKISRVELWVNDTLIAKELSPVENGISPFPLVTDWTPPTIRSIQAGCQSI